MFETTNQSCSLLPNSKNHLRNATAKSFLNHLKTKRLQALSLKLPESERPKSELFQRNWSLDTARSTKPCALPFGTPKELLRNFLGVVDVKIFREAPKPKSWPSVHCSCALGHLDGFCNLMITAVFPFVLLQELFRLCVVHLEFLLHICSSMQQEYLKFLSPACLSNKQVPFAWTLPWNMKAFQRGVKTHIKNQQCLGHDGFPLLNRLRHQVLFENMNGDILGPGNEATDWLRSGGTLGRPMHVRYSNLFNMSEKQTLKWGGGCFQQSRIPKTIQNWSYRVTHELSKIARTLSQLEGSMFKHSSMLLCGGVTFAQIISRRSTSMYIRGTW